MNLGLPYKGSKNTIANDIVKAIPRGGKILDACCGGGAFFRTFCKFSKIFFQTIDFLTKRSIFVNVRQ